MDHIWRILALIRAVNTNEFLLCADSIHQIFDILFNFDGQNYARYLTFFSILNVPNVTFLMPRVVGRGPERLSITDRLEKHDKLFEPIKRMNLKTMEDMGKKVKVKFSQKIRLWNAGRKETLQCSC